MDLDALPAVLRESDSSRPAIVRIPAEDEVCEPHPGAPEGGQPLISFPEPSRSAGRAHRPAPRGAQAEPTGVVPNMSVRRPTS